MASEESLEARMAVLIESIKNLSTITGNHDVLLTKLIDDHEQRIRLLEKCALASKVIEELEVGTKELEKRIRLLENWRWYIIGISVGISVVLSFVGAKLLGWI